MKRQFSQGIKDKAVVKEWLKPYIADIKSIKKVYKYLTFDSGVKMLQNNNVQFTRANMLNDEVDCHISKVNFDYITREIDKISAINTSELIEKIKSKHGPTFSSFGICSLGTTPDNLTLWNDYTRAYDNTSNGICIELNLSATIDYILKSGIKVVSFRVDYIDDTIESIPYELYLGNDMERSEFLRKVLATKNRTDWEQEQEVRIILPEELTQEYRRLSLYKSCFGNIYVGCDISSEEYETISTIVSNNYPKMKILQQPLIE